MIAVRQPESIYKAQGEIENGTFTGRWHFSLDQYCDDEYMQFGNLRVFNDDTLSPGAVWPLHPHHDIEVVTYCADGQFRHADEHGKGGVLKKGWVQHTTVGSGLWHSEINNSKDIPMRFIQMWFLPSQRAYGLITFIPSIFMAVTTFIAGFDNIFNNYLPKHTFQGNLNAILSALMLVLVIILFFEALRKIAGFWKRGLQNESESELVDTTPSLSLDIPD